MNNTQLSVAISVALITTTSHAASQLKPLLVSANHVPTQTHSVTADYHVITAEDIAEKHYQTLDAAIQSVPGIQVSRNGGLGGVTSVFMRGQSNNATLILVDGVEMNNPMGTGGAILSNILISDVEAIEILKGPQSGIWGANASAGVIHILTKRQQAGAHGLINVETGSNETKKLAANFSVGSEKYDFKATFSDLSTQGFSSVKEAGQSVTGYEDDAFKQTDFSLQTTIKFNTEQQLDLFVKHSDSFSEYDYATNPNQSDFASVHYENSVKRIQYTHLFDKLNLSAFLSQNDIKQYSDAAIYALGLRGNYDYAKSQSLAFVMEKKQYENQANGDRYHNAAVGVTNTQHFLNNSLVVTQAIRQDQYDDFDNKTTGKLGLKKHYANNVYAKANIGTAYNAPSLFQTTYGITDKLNPEHTQSFDIGVGGYGLEMSVYQSNTKDLISYAGSWPNDYYTNLSGTSTFKGLELAYAHFFKTIDLGMSVNYTQASAKDDSGKWLARRAKNSAYLGLSYEGLQDWTFASDTRYLGKSYDLPNQQGAQIGDYFVTDLNVSYRVNDNLNVYANVLNAFAKDYTHAVASYTAFDITQPPQHVYSNGGRQFFIGVQAKL